MKSRTTILMFIAGGLAIAPVLRAEPPVVVTPGTSTTTTTTTTESAGVWTTVPEDYEGDYFIYNNQYYHGGKIEHGDFTFEGHPYHDRYMHDGKWMYGGKWEHHARKAAKHAEHEAEKGR
jgi:hypothetical protein